MLNQFRDADRLFLRFNGFQIGLSNSDIFLALLHNNRAVAHVNLSYTTAKTLGQQLMGAIQTLEKESKNSIMSIEDINKFLKDEFDEKKSGSSN